MAATVPLMWTLYKDHLRRFGVTLPIHGIAWRGRRINEFTNWVRMTRNFGLGIASDRRPLYTLRDHQASRRTSGFPAGSMGDPAAGDVVLSAIQKVSRCIRHGTSPLPSSAH